MGSGSEMLQRGATIRLRSLLRPRVRRAAWVRGGANAGAPLSALAEAVHSRCVCVGETRDGPDSPAERRERVDACEKPSKLARRETRVAAESIFARRFPDEDATPKEDSRAPQDIAADIAARIVPTSYLEWTKAGGEARAWVRRVGVGRRPSRVPSKEPKRTPWS